MLKLSVGWQDLERVPFSSIVESYRDKIDEVYFPWVNMATGRSVIGGFDGWFDYTLQQRLLEELKTIRNM